MHAITARQARSMLRETPAKPPAFPCIGYRPPNTGVRHLFRVNHPEKMSDTSACNTVTA
jgi:hypothetical protein